MKSAAVTVQTTATLIIGPDNKNRHVYIHNGGGAKIYIGDSGVTTANGYHLANNEAVELLLPIDETLYAVVASNTNVITTLVPDVD